MSIVPPGFQVLASTEKSANQVMTKGKRYFTFQGHPEYSAGFVRALINMRKASGIFTPSFAEQALQVVDSPLDTAAMISAIFKFLNADNKS